jgi:glycosyltransferase involved in cell wall biosynthesis
MGMQELAEPSAGVDRRRPRERMGAFEELTLLICTHDNARMLDRALESIAGQVIPAELRWEVLVVANRCTDETPAVIRRWSRDARIPRLRYVSERRAGITFARKRGLRESRGRLVGFVDDDCLLAPDWATEVLGFAAEHPRAGVFGGRNELVWEAPPSWLADLYGDSLARQDLGPRPRMLPVGEWRLPVGAGLVLRREAVIDSGWITSGVLRSRRPGLLHCGEDAEIGIRIRRAGWEVWYSPAQRLRHVIPPERMGLRYLRRLHRGFGRAEPFLRALARAPQPHPRAEAVAWSAGVLREVLHRYREGYVRYEKERPTWLIRLSHARGCLEGAMALLLTGRGW